MIAPDTSLLVAFEKAGILDLLGRLPFKTVIGQSVLKELLVKSPDPMLSESILRSACDIIDSANAVIERLTASGIYLHPLK